MRLLLPILIVSLGVSAHAAGLCSDLFGVPPSINALGPTEIYLRLVRHLALTKNVLSADDLSKLASEDKLPDPTPYLNSSAGPEVRFALKKALAQLGNADPVKAKAGIVEISRDLRKTEAGRTEAQRETHFILTPVAIDMPRDWATSWPSTRTARK